MEASEQLAGGLYTPRTIGEFRKDLVGISDSNEIDRQNMEEVLNSIIDKFPENATRIETERGLLRDTDKSGYYGVSLKTMIHEVPTFIPRVEVHEIIREVPKVEIDWVEKIVEVPQQQFIDTYEEITEIKYVPKPVPKIEIVDIPREVIKTVPRVEIRTIEQKVHVPSGEQIPIPQTCGVATEFVVPNFFDKKVPVIVSQQIIPEVYETDEILCVPAVRYIPYLVPVDVYVPKPVRVPARDRGIISREEIPAHNVDPALLQQLTVELNPHLQQLEQYNKSQQGIFNELMNQSYSQAQTYNFEVPSPATLPLISMDHENINKNAVESNYAKQYTSNFMSYANIKHGYAAASPSPPCPSIGESRRPSTIRSIHSSPRQ